jgi:hypothetical protein
MDPPPAQFRWRTILAVVLLLATISPSIAIYCDEDDCYDLLGSAIPTLHVSFPQLFFNFLDFQS